MTSFAEQFEQQITQGKVPKPIPRWFVQTKHIAIWMVFGIFVAVGVMSTGISVWFMTDPQGVITEYRNEEIFYNVLTALPVYWIGLSLLMGVAAVMVFVNAPRGYRYRTAVVGGSVILAFIAFGGALSAVGLSDRIEEAAAYIPGYRMFQAPRFERMMKPDPGMVIGQIQEFAPPVVRIRDPRGIIWQVDITHCDPMRAEHVAEVSRCVRVMGVASTTDFFFDAQVIKPCPRGIRPEQIRKFLEPRMKEPARP